MDEYAMRIIRGVGVDIVTIDTLLSGHVSGWSLGRLGVLERAILRVAVYELTTETEIPVAVVVDEAVGLAKKFCSGEAGSLVNGVLGSVAREVRPVENPSVDLAQAPQ
jgi:N utilization substance protein B